MNKPMDIRVLLVIDDDRTFCQIVADQFSSPTIRILFRHTATEGLQVCREQRVDLVLLDENLPDGQGHRICTDIMATNERCKIIFITAYPSYEHVLKAIKNGAYDYLSKPFELVELNHAIERARHTQELEKVQSWQSYHIRKNLENSLLIGSLGQGSEISRLLKRATEIDSPVLITGETGTGKTVVAKAIHYSSCHQEAPFISINCAAIPENLIEAELFGHDKGAFTGAIGQRKGLFELADGGTLFLDEIGAMPVLLQTKLLSVLDDGMIRRLGSHTQFRVHVRIIAATNTYLPDLIRNHGFREDLYYRLNVMPIHLPPLRERPTDIVTLADHFTRQFGGMALPSLPESELENLRNYNWPGNVRELRNIIERSFILDRDDPRPSRLLPALPTALSSNIKNHPILAGCTLEETCSQRIREVLIQHEGNLTRSARTLGISLSTLKRTLKRKGSPLPPPK